MKPRTHPRADGQDHGERQVPLEVARRRRLRKEKIAKRRLDLGFSRALTMDPVGCYDYEGLHEQYYSL